MSDNPGVLTMDVIAERRDYILSAGRELAQLFIPLKSRRPVVRKNLLIQFWWG